MILYKEIDAASPLRSGEYAWIREDAPRFRIREREERYRIEFLTMVGRWEPINLLSFTYRPGWQSPPYSSLKSAKASLWRYLNREKRKKEA